MPAIPPPTVPPGEDDRQRFTRTRYLPLCTGMARLLALMVGDSGRERWRRDGQWLCQCTFDHPDFEIRIACRDKRIRPFLAYMDRPWKHSAYLGRLRPDGTVHVYAHGMRVFCEQLAEQGVLERFTDALREAVARYQALDRPHDAPRPATVQADNGRAEGDASRHDPTAPGITH